MTLRRLFVVAATLVALGPATAEAQDDATRARELFERGVTLMQNEDWGAALVQLDASFRLWPTQVALFDMGLCLERLHRYREAIDTFERLVNEFADRGTEARVELARTELANLRALFGTLRIDVRPAGAEVIVDGEVVGTSPLAEPVALTGGTHTITARLAGHEPAERAIAVVVGTSATVELELRPATEPVPPPVARHTANPPARPVRERVVVVGAQGLRPGWFWSAVALSGAAAVTTAILGSLALAGDADYRDSRIRLASDREDGKRLVILTDVALGVSIASAVAAVLLYGNTTFASEHDDRAVRPVVLAAPGGFGLALSGDLR